MRKKMKTILLLLLTVLFAAPVYSNGDGTWVTQISGIGADLNAVYFTDANNGTAVGRWWNGYGIILRTTNGGTNWIQQSSGEPFDLYDVCFTDANIGTVVGSGGRILRTTDGGTTWTSQTSVTVGLVGVSFTDANNGTAVGNFGIIMRTINGGTNWTYHFTGENHNLTGVSFVDANTGTVVGIDNGIGGGIILRTTDGGTTWTSQSTAFNLRGVSFTDANNGTAVAEFGVILRTTNGGTTWTSQSGGINFLYSVSFTDANNGTVVGWNGGISRTINGGLNWILQTSGTSNQLRGVSFTDANNGSAVGENGTILRYKPNPNYGNNLQAGDNLYYFANSTTGAANAPSQPVFDWRDTTGSTDLILNGMSIAPIGAGTVDNGQYGFSLPVGQSIRFFGADYNVVAVGTNGIVGFTAFDPTNTGSVSTTGLPQNVFTGPAIFPLWMDLDYGDVDVPINRLSYKVTSSEVIITYDRAPLSGADANDYVSFQVVISHSISPTQNSKIIVQFDDAASGSAFINKYNTNTLPPHISGLQGSNNSSQILQYRYFNSSAFLISDGPLFGSPLAVAFGPDNTALPVELASFTASVNMRDVYLNWTTASEMNNSGFIVERSNVKGQTSNEWMKIGFINGNGTTNESKNYSYTDLGLITGSYNYRLKQVDYNGNFEYFNLSNEIIIGIPEKYDLSQNYPNPFNPTTKINFNLPFDGKVTMTIFDIAGREIATLVNDIHEAGYYTVTFDAKGISSGAYFYRIVAEGGDQKFVMTKKMVVIK
jgi:photosystem II stability/assembly factor-like uncharacterized protein